MTEKNYTADQVKKMLSDSMDKFRSSMVGLIRECAAHPKYATLSGKEALVLVADKLDELNNEG
ncbi:MAG: hypothetical protein E6Q97_34220 [Desulfurellales bacterium]|nr:MAG: hypothetical protein E6Q97_34220 [Desulfurellales bacterium]